MRIRKATKSDAEKLAKLINLAGEGVPFYLWQQMKVPNQTTLEFGAQRAARDEGGFSYRHAWVAEVEGEVAAMILGYSQPDPYDLDDLHEYPEFLRPIVELEAQAPGSWYINALATFEQFQRQGLGSRLIKFSENIERDKTGETDEAGETEEMDKVCRQLSLIVSSVNSGAKRLYESLGFVPRASKEIIPITGLQQDGNWVLMVKEL